MSRVFGELAPSALFVLGVWVALALIVPLLPHGTAALAHAPWLVWDLSPTVLVALALALLWYRRGQHPSRAGGLQPLLFGLGLATLFFALQSPFHAYAVRFFSIRQIEQIALTTIAPLCLVLAAPQAAMRRGMPDALGKALAGWFAPDRPIARFLATLSRPVAVTVLFAVVTDLWLLPVLHDASVRLPLVGALWEASLFASGLIFFYRVLDGRTEGRSTSLLARLLMCWAAEVNVLLVGFYLSFKTEALYMAYGRMAPFWHVSALSDENFGAMTLWIPGSMMIAIGALVALYRAARHEERQVVIERMLPPPPPIRHHEFRAARAAGNRALLIGLLGFVALVIAMTAGMAVTFERTIGHMDRIAVAPTPAAQPASASAMSAVARSTPASSTSR